VVSQPFGIKIPALVVDQLKAIDGPGFIKNDAVRFELPKNGAIQPTQTPAPRTNAATLASSNPRDFFIVESPTTLS